MEKFKLWVKDWGALTSIWLLVIASLFSSGGLVGGTITKPNTFSPGTTIRSSEINANFDTLYNEVNGNLDNANIDAAANIAATKIAGTAIVSSPSSPQDIFGTTTNFGNFFVSTTVGQFVVPRMTTAQRTALTNVLNGAIVYDSTAGQFYGREGGNWTGITPIGVTATSSFTGKGVIEQATGAEAAATSLYGTGSTDAPLAITADITTSSRQIVGYYVPVTRSDGTLSNTFGGGASGLATLDGNTLVVQNPASATSTPTALSIPIAGAGGTIADGWIGVQSNEKFTVSSTQVLSSSTVEMVHATGTIPAGFLGTNNAAIIDIPISLFSINASRNVTIRLYYGSTVVASTTVTENSAVNRTGFIGRLKATLIATGSANTQKGILDFSSSSTTFPGTAIGSLGTGTGAENSANALPMYVTTQYSSNDTSVHRFQTEAAVGYIIR